MSLWGQPGLISCLISNLCRLPLWKGNKAISFLVKGFFFFLFTISLKCPPKPKQPGAHKIKFTLHHVKSLLKDQELMKSSHVPVFKLMKDETSFMNPKGHWTATPTHFSSSMPPVHWWLGRWFIWAAMLWLDKLTWRSLVIHTGLNQRMSQVFFGDRFDGYTWSFIWKKWEERGEHYKMEPEMQENRGTCGCYCQFGMELTLC